MEQKKEFVTYADGIDEEKAVITIGGREYAAVPMYYPAALAAKAVESVDKHGLDGLGYTIRNEYIDRIMAEIRMRLEHCAAFTAVEEEEPDERIRRFSLFLPMLLPLDERDRWCLEMTEEQQKQMEDDWQRRMGTGRPRAFKVVDKEEFEV